MGNILLKNSTAWVDARWPERFIHSSLIVAFCFLLRWMLDDYVQPYLPTECFFIGSMVIAYRYGYVTSMISLIAGWLIGIYFFVEPYGRFSMISTFDVVVTLDDFITGLAGIGVLEYLQRTRYSQKLMLLVSDSRYRSLLHLDHHRLHQQRLSARELRTFTDVLLQLDRVLLVMDQGGRRQWMPGSPFAEQTMSSDGAEKIHADDRTAFFAALNSVLDGTRESIDLSFRYDAGNGEFLPMECVFRAMHRAGRNKCYVLIQKIPRIHSAMP